MRDKAETLVLLAHNCRRRDPVRFEAERVLTLFTINVGRHQCLYLT